MKRSEQKLDSDRHGLRRVILIARPGSGLVLEASAGLPGAAVCYAFYQLTTRKLSPTEHPVTMLFYTALVGTVCMSFTPCPGYGEAPA